MPGYQDDGFTDKTDVHVREDGVGLLEHKVG